MDPGSHWGVKVQRQFGLTFVVVAALFSSSAPAQDLQGELAGLLASHPAVRAADEEASAAQAGVSEARSGFFPRASVSGDYGYGSVDSPSRRASGEGDFDSSQTALRATVTQKVFDGLKQYGQVGSAEASSNIADLRAEAIRQNVLFDGITAYLEVLQQTELAGLSRSNEKTIQRQLALEDERVRLGSGIALDALFAKSRLQLSKERRVAIEGNLNVALNRYQRVFGAAPMVKSMTTPQPPISLLPPDKESAMQLAMQQNLSALASIQQVVVADEERRIARSTYFPQVDLEASANYEEDFDGTPGIRRDWSVLVRARWDIFDGFLTPARAERADRLHGAALATNVDTARQAREEAESAWDSLQTASQRLELLSNAVAIATEVFDARKKLREAGKETAINVLDAESELFNARINFTAARYEAILASYRVLLAIGALSASNLGVATNG